MAAAVAGMVAFAGTAPTRAQAIASIPFESIPEGTTVEGGGSPITLDGEVVVSGTVRHQGVVKQGHGSPVTYETSIQRYVVEASPAEAGQLVQLDHDLVIALCRDVDGCEIVLGIVRLVGDRDYVFSRTSRLFLSETQWWVLADFDVTGQDGNGSYSIWMFDDCLLTDGESGQVYTSRADLLPGFALVNPIGGIYPDNTTGCRVVLID